jgi:hypothetical protein
VSASVGGVRPRAHRYGNRDLGAGLRGQLGAVDGIFPLGIRASIVKLGRLDTATDRHTAQLRLGDLEDGIDRRTEQLGAVTLS